MTIKEALNFEVKLYNLINTCGLPLDTAYYILKSVYFDLQKIVYEYAEKNQQGYVTEEQVLHIDNEKAQEAKIELNIDNAKPIE